MNVTLVRRWGYHKAGSSVDVDEVQAAWLVQHHYAESSGELVAPVQVAAAEGTHGADPLAGGDATRRRPHVPRSTGSVASQAPGSPPAFRGGFDGDASARQGEAGRALPEAQDGVDDAKKPRRSRSKSEA
jgi:hypothetical protein